LARIFPSDWRSVETLGAAQREIETLAMLEQSLMDAYTIYHGVHWTRVGNGFSMFGEIDFVVVNPAGSMLLIEQKSGFLKETTDGLVKDYGTKQKTVPVQMARTADECAGNSRWWTRTSRCRSKSCCIAPTTR